MQVREWTRHKMKLEFILTMIIVGLLSGFGGFMFGVKTSLDFCISTGMHFLTLKGVDLGVDQPALENAIWSYKNNIDQWIICSEQLRYCQGVK